MTRADEMQRIYARRRRTLALFCFAALFGLIVLSVRTDRAGAEGGGGALVAEPVLSATAAGVRTLFGATPGEAPGEIWGAGKASGEGGDLVRYTEAGGWEVMPPPTNAEGGSVSLSRTAIPATATAGRTTPDGGVVTVAALGPVGSSEPQVLLVREPGGQFRAIAPPEAPIVSSSEKLFSASSVRLTAIEEPGGRTGAFVVPSAAGSISKQVLHWNGSQWTPEPICLTPASEPCTKKPATGFTVLAIEGISPENAWILARQPRHSGAKASGEGIVLLKRTAAGEWRKQPLGGTLGSLYEKEEEEVGGTTVYPGAREKGQPLTVTSAGVWVDASIRVGSTTATAEGATIYYSPAKGEVVASWCDLGESNAAVGAAFCTHPLGLELPNGEGRSFAWPGQGGAGEEFGTRVITGVGNGAIAIFENGAFTKIPLDGNGGSAAGAAMTAPDEGWLGPSYRLTRAPISSSLKPWPVPFRRPLTAIAGQPGEPIGSLNAQAIAVGEGGQVARYIPGVGWQAETLLTGSGTHATPDLRGVAWPEPGIAYAVGNEGAMWLWRASTELWEPDPGAPTNLIRGNFTGIAFQPGEPARGYAVGKQGLLLGYGKRWTQEALPAGLNPEVNITSIAFAGSEAIATYTIPVSRGPNTSPIYTGGLLVNDGSGWQVEEEATKVLATAEAGGEGVAPRRVAGLPDGGAVVVGITGGVVERETTGAPWHVASSTPLGYPAAVAAIREGGQLRAILSVEGNPIGGFTPSAEHGTDEAQATGQPQEGLPPLLTKPYPLPKNGYVVRQTATGWRDEEHQSYPPPSRVQGQTEYDLPRTPDAVLALLINPEGGEGWAVGGNTGEEGGAEFAYEREAIQTGSAMRFGAGAAPPENAQTVPINIPANAATFAIGGNASCVGPCAEQAGTGIGPDVWLRSAVEKAAGISGLRAFLYTGSSVAPSAAGLGRFAFGEEEAAYARRLGSGAGSLPVYAAPSSTDRYENSLSIFNSRFEGFQWPFGKAPPAAGRGIVAGEPAADPAVNDSYWFESTSPTGEHPVRVIVLDQSLETGSNCWLVTQLAAARHAHVPAIVVGNNEVGSGETGRILVSGESPLCPLSQPAGVASAYFYKSTSNRQQTLTWGGVSIPAFGTGTLGYIRLSEPASERHTPASGFLLASVGEPNGADLASVTVSLIPNIGSLAIDATDGTLLRRSQPALFEGLARRPLAGYSCGGSPVAPEVCAAVSPDPYVQIPDRCIRGYEGASCASELLAEYRFTSSHPDIANFVEVDPASTDPRAVYLKNGKPVADPKSGLLCAFNAGTTTVTVETGELSYSIPVTVQAGSVARPCGTVPLENQPTLPPRPTVPPPPPTPLPGQHFTQPGGTLPPPNVPVVSVTPGTPAPPAVHHPIKPPAPAPSYFLPAFNPTIIPTPLIVPPPPAPVVEPTPPSGTSPVTQPAVSPQPEEEEEAAFDLVHHMAAYRPQRGRNAAAVISSHSGGGPSARYFVPALVLLLALAGAGVATPRRRTSRLAYETRATPRRPLR